MKNRFNHRINEWFLIDWYSVRTITLVERSPDRSHCRRRVKTVVFRLDRFIVHYPLKIRWLLPPADPNPSTVMTISGCLPSRSPEAECEVNHHSNFSSDKKKKKKNEITQANSWNERNVAVDRCRCSRLAERAASAQVFSPVFAYELRGDAVADRRAARAAGCH